jgi:hypothetical protein
MNCCPPICAKSIERTYFKLGINLIRGFPIHKTPFGSWVQHSCYYFIEALVKIRFDMFLVFNVVAM